MCPLSTAISRYGLHFLPYTVQCRSYSKKNCKSVYNYSTVLGAAIICKPYSEITVEIGTHLKTVKTTLNIFAVFFIPRMLRFVLSILFLSLVWSLIVQLDLNHQNLAVFLVKDILKQGGSHDTSTNVYKMSSFSIHF